jgi:protoporphyrinogen oxidase
MPDHWGIVGGGMLGMTLAHRLAGRGHRVSLLEASDHLGGLADSRNIGDFTWDRFYHVILLSDGHLRRLLSELGLDSEVRWAQSRTGFFTDGRFHSMSNSLEFLRFPPLGIFDKVRLAATIWRASRIKDWKELEGIPVTDWLLRWSGARTLDKIWMPLLRAKLGENYRRTSAAFIWTSIARMYAARRSGLKKEMFGYLPGGYARLLEQMAGMLTSQHVDINLNHSATSVMQAKTGGVAITFRDGREETFDRVAVTLPAPAAAEICPTLTATEQVKLRGVPYLGIVCAAVLMKRPLRGFYVTNITDAGVPFTAVIEMSALTGTEPFGGLSMVYLPKYLDGDGEGLKVPDSEVEERFLGALDQMYPGCRKDVLSVQISRASHVAPLPFLHYSHKLPPVDTSIPGLFLVNSSQIVNGTMNVNETVHLAEQALTNHLDPQ